MSEFSAATYPEVFVSNAAISKAVYEAVQRGELRKIGSRLYTRNLTEDPERLVRRNWYDLITSCYPDAPGTSLRPLPSPGTGLPRLPVSPFQRALPTTPADRTGAIVDFFPARAAFP